MISGIGSMWWPTVLSECAAMLVSLIRGAKATLFPSLYEGFGFPPLEAMARGCPVVAARTGAVPEVLGDLGFVVPRLVHGVVPHRAHLVEPIPMWFEGIGELLEGVERLVVIRRALYRRP